MNPAEIEALIREGLPGATVRGRDVTDPASLARDGLRGERFDALVSCLASRTGVPADAWAIDHRANLTHQPGTCPTEPQRHPGHAGCLAGLFQPGI